MGGQILIEKIINVTEKTYVDNMIYPVDYFESSKMEKTFGIFLITLILFIYFNQNIFTLKAILVLLITLYLIFKFTR